MIDDQDCYNKAKGSPSRETYTERPHYNNKESKIKKFKDLQREAAKFNLNTREGLILDILTNKRKLSIKAKYKQKQKS